MKKYNLRVFLFFFLFFGIERFCHHKTHGFRVQNIYSSLPNADAWEIPPPNKEELLKIRTILSQSFYFLDSGGESYVFCSKDGKYVLKFFKHHHMDPKKWISFFLPSSLGQKYKNKKINRLNQFFSSCKLAYERFRTHTGLIYLHLNKTSYLDSSLSLYDPCGVKHPIDLDLLSFALQEKAVMAYPTLKFLVELKEEEAAKKRLSSLIDLIVARCQSGLLDHDARKRNFGFIGERAVEIDLGSFSLDESLKTPEATESVLLEETIKLRRYVKKYIPQLQDFLEKKITNCLRKNPQDPIVVDHA